MSEDILINRRRKKDNCKLIKSVGQNMNIYEFNLDLCSSKPEQVGNCQYCWCPGSVLPGRQLPCYWLSSGTLISLWHVICNSIGKNHWFIWNNVYCGRPVNPNHNLFIFQVTSKLLIIKHIVNLWYRSHHIQILKCFSSRFAVVLNRGWRYSWSSADRRCANYIWVINNDIA